MIKKSVALASLVVLSLIAAPALAQKDKDDKPGQDKERRTGRVSRRTTARQRGRRRSRSQRDLFVLSDRICCGELSARPRQEEQRLPPGQAKKVWAIGQPLPGGVVYYPMPPVLLGQLSPLPAGYQYVRVANASC